MPATVSDLVSEVQIQKYGSNTYQKICCCQVGAWLLPLRSAGYPPAGLQTEENSRPTRKIPVAGRFSKKYTRLKITEIINCFPDWDTCVASYCRRFKLNTVGWIGSNCVYCSGLGSKLLPVVSRTLPALSGIRSHYVIHQVARSYP